jgi:acetyl-CoA carboxylase biotin carboxylase subunit
VAGGGGRGMRIAHNDVSFAKEFDTARRGREGLRQRRGLSRKVHRRRPRHIEFQILADSHGKVIHLGERDCSVQSRHQKLIEEAPSPFLTLGPSQENGQGRRSGPPRRPSTRTRARSSSSWMPRGNFYFIEMNTRIQVEHPVTEEVTGIDLIKQQIHVANGLKLEFDQGDIKWEKHAIECRINAEDPGRNFAPSPGTIGLYYAPGGPGVRIDSHVYSGYVIPPNTC